MNENKRQEVLSGIFADLRSRTPDVDWATYERQHGVETAGTVDPDEIDGFLTLSETLTGFVRLAASADWAPTLGQIARYVGSLDEPSLFALADRTSTFVTADVVLAQLSPGARHVLVSGLQRAAESLLDTAIGLPLANGLKFRLNEIGDLEFQQREHSPS